MGPSEPRHAVISGPIEPLHSPLASLLYLRAINEAIIMALLPVFRPALRHTCRRFPRITPARRSLHLAPPWLLDDYIPRYHLISSLDAAKKRSLAYAHLKECNLCPRLCGVNRYEKTGVCMIGATTVKVNTIAPHFGEEPCLQGHNGSGSVFFSGCNLRCVFCQNRTSAVLLRLQFC